MPSKQETSPPLSEAQKTRKKHSTASPKHRGRSPSQDTARALKNTTTPQPQHQGYPPLKGGGGYRARRREEKKAPTHHWPRTTRHKRIKSRLNTSIWLRFSAPYGLLFTHIHPNISSNIRATISVILGCSSIVTKGIIDNTHQIRPK